MISTTLLVLLPTQPVAPQDALRFPVYEFADIRVAALNNRIEGVSTYREGCPSHEAERINLVLTDLIWRRDCWDSASWSSYHQRQGRYPECYANLARLRCLLGEDAYRQGLLPDPLGSD